MMATDEVQAAAERVAESIKLAANGVSEEDALNVTYGGDIGGFTRDMETLASATLSRLADDEQQAKEDAEPITEEWLRSLADHIASNGDFKFVFRLDDWETFVSVGYSTRGTWWVTIEQDEHEVGSGEDGESRDIVAVGDVKTRGQLRKLIEALKGGDA